MQLPTKRGIFGHGTSFHSLAVVLLTTVWHALESVKVGYAYVLTINQRNC